MFWNISCSRVWVLQFPYDRCLDKSAVNFGIPHKPHIPNENVMVCELVSVAWDGMSGMIEICIEQYLVASGMKSEKG